MRFTVFAIFLCAVAVPAAAIAQADADADLLTTKWTLKQPKKKPAARQVAAKNPEVAGPAVPPPQRIFVPKAHKPKPRATQPTFRTKANATPIIRAMTRGDHRN